MPICEDYLKAKENALFFGNILKNGIALINKAIPWTVIVIIKWVGENNQTL